MIDDETMQSVRELRARGLSPKEIARSLGMRPAAVADLVRRVAAERDAADPGADLVDCWVNAGWSTVPSIAGRPEWRDPGADDGTGGLVTALVARRRRHRRSVTVSIYLLDAYCLGVKNAMGPDNMKDQALRRLMDHVFSGYHAPPVSAIELVCDLVLGAAEYAYRLGFAPHPDFERARAHLGPVDWAERDHVRTRQKANLRRGSLRRSQSRPSRPAPRGRTQGLPLHGRARSRRTGHGRLTSSSAVSPRRCGSQEPHRRSCVTSDLNTGYSGGRQDHAHHHPPASPHHLVFIPASLAAVRRNWVIAVGCARAAAGREPRVRRPFAAPPPDLAGAAISAPQAARGAAGPRSRAARTARTHALEGERFWARSSPWKANNGPGSPIAPSRARYSGGAIEPVSVSLR